jgi:hypothetical protein
VHAAASGRRRDSHVAAAIDLGAAAALISATTLADALEVAVKTAPLLLDGLVGVGIAVKVTRRSKRRLFGQRYGIARRRRPPALPAEPGRGRSRPPNAAVDEDVVAGPAVPLPRLALADRRTFDDSDLERGMAQLDLVLRRTRRSLDALMRRTGGATVP